MERVLDTVMRQGAHAVIFGERGVGKTSLASLIEVLWRDAMRDDDLLASRYNCQPSDDYINVWANIGEDIESRLTVEQRSKNRQFDEYIHDMSLGAADPTHVRRTFRAFNGVAVIIIDEFDRLEDPDTVERMADTIKGLSDYSVETTLVIVGVADTIDQLIANHASVDRNLTQILLSRFGIEDIVSVIKSRYDGIGLGYDEGIIEFMANLTRGLPYYAHLIGQWAGLAAIRNERTVVGRADVMQGLTLATENAQESVKRAYANAVSSTRTNSIHRQVLLACALVQQDEFGFFTASNVRQPLTRLLGLPVEVSRYLRYLSEFTGNGRGEVLQEEGRPWRKRYRFSDPLLATYVILKGLEDGLVDADMLMP